MRRSRRMIRLALVLFLVFLGARPAEAQCISSHGATIASFCDGRLMASHDDGATWADLGTDDLYASAAVTEAGEVLALTTGPQPLHLAFENGHTSAPMPLDAAEAVRSDGTDIYVLGSRDVPPPSLGTWSLPEHFVIVSRDGGATWEDLGRLENYASLGTFTVTHRGARPAEVRIWSIEGLSCFGSVIDRVYAYDGRIRGAVLRDDVECAYHGRPCSRLDVIGLGAHGSAYGLVATGDEHWQLAHVRPEERIERTGLAVDEQAIVAHNGRITLAVVDGALIRLDGARHRVLSRDVPSGTISLHVDDRGRALAAIHGGFTPDGGGRVSAPAN